MCFYLRSDENQVLGLQLPGKDRYLIGYNRDDAGGDPDHGYQNGREYKWNGKRPVHAGHLQTIHYRVEDVAEDECDQGIGNQVTEIKQHNPYDHSSPCTKESLQEPIN